MASLQDVGIPDAGVGILHPAMANRWRVLLGSKKRLTMQAVRCEADMLHSEVTIFIEQPAAMAQDMLNDIRDLARGDFDFRLQLMDGNDTAIGEICGFAKLTGHNFALDYALSGVAVHVLKLHYTPSAM